MRDEDGLPELRELQAVQSGVLSRHQAIGLGLGDADLRRMVRRRELVVLRRGVYLDHTGEPTWLQRAWAAVLGAAPAALAGTSALRALDRPGRAGGESSDPIHVAVDEKRRVSAPQGVRLSRVVDLDRRVLWNASPPRLRTEDALLDVASRARSELEAIAVLADAVQARRTTPRRLLDSLGRRERIGRRRLLEGVLADLDAGTGSVLEHGYLHRVERAHRLPRGLRQASLRGLAARHDVLYERARVVVELDGRAFHSLSQDRFHDLDRDLAAAVADHVTVRLGWAQVFGQPCLTAARVGLLLQRRGWTGSPRACPDC